MLYLAMDWQHMLVQLLMGNPDRRARLADELDWTCFLLMEKSKQCSGFLTSKQYLILSVGVCIFALRQLGCSDAVITWVQDHAQVIDVTLALSCCSANSATKLHRTSCTIGFCCPVPFLVKAHGTCTPKGSSQCQLCMLQLLTHSAHTGLALLATTSQHCEKACRYLHMHSCVTLHMHLTSRVQSTG